MKKLARIDIFDPSQISLAFTVFDHLFRSAAPEKSALREALEEVIENILQHAYEEAERFWVEVSFSDEDGRSRIDVADGGMPFDFGRYRSEPVEHSADHTKGFYRIYDLVERFYFANLPGRGKRFSLIASFPVSRNEASGICGHSQEPPIREHIHIRRFERGDGEGIARLIYRNYDHTYYKTLYYDPQGIEEANEQGEIVSIVAESGGMIIGHFALILSKFSNIAEIGAAVVDPRFKGRGTMNEMFDRLISLAREKNLGAIYGEAIMIHPYSQRANLRHGMVESAIALGEVPSSIEIEHRLKDTMRSGAVESFLLFDRYERSLRLPSRYRRMIAHTYRSAAIRWHDTPLPPVAAEHTITHRYNPAINVGFIVIDALPTSVQLDAALDALLLQQCDMIYADINLHRISAVDDLVALLNGQRFFYAGVMFSFYRGEDYLRLQRKNTFAIDEEQLVCYSEFTRDLLAFILEDERQVSRF